MTTTWDEILSYRQQMTMILERQRFMEVFHTHEATAKNDARLLEDLRAVSPEKLNPVLIWPEQDDPRVGYLVQKTNAGSHRVLLCLDSWKIIRVKASARIWPLKDDEAFKSAVIAQQECDRAVAYILRKVHAEPGKKTQRNGVKA